MDRHVEKKTSGTHYSQSLALAHRQNQHILHRLAANQIGKSFAVDDTQKGHSAGQDHSATDSDARINKLVQRSADLSCWQKGTVKKVPH